jgi:ABC-type amino acid transport substrate-binding protein
LEADLLMPARPSPTRRGLLQAGAAACLPGVRPAAARPSGALERILQTRTLRLGAWLGVPPLGMRSEFGTPDGLDIELAVRLAAGIDVALRVVPLAPRDRIPALLANRIDLLGTIAVTPPALLRVAFAAPHSEICIVGAARRGSGIRGGADLAGRRLAIPGTASVATILQQQLPDGAEAFYVEDFDDALEALAAGQADVAILPGWTVASQMRLHPELDLEQVLTIGSWRFGFAVRPGEHDLLRLVTTFLGLARSDGTLSEVERIYMGNFGGACLAP